MPLRDFDQVRERIQLRIEVRHIAQGVVLVLVLVGAAFAGGGWYARQAAPTPARGVTATFQPAPDGLPPAAVALAEAASRMAEAPIYPKPAVIAVAPDAAPTVDPEAVAAEPPPADPGAPEPPPEPSAEQLATAPDERTVSPAEVAAANAPAAAEAVKSAAPVAVPPAAAVAPKAVMPVAPPPAAVVKTAAPHGLGLFGTLRMAPTVALVSAAPPAVAAAKPVAPATAPVPARKPVVHPREDDVRPPTVSGHYVIQVKAFRDEAEAKAFETDLRAKGHAPKLTSIDVPDKGTFYRVRLGPFDSLEAARAAQKQFEAAESEVTILLAVP